MKSIEVNEPAVRRRVERAGYVMRKSRHEIGFDNWGEFRLIDAETNVVVLGSQFDASLVQIAEFITAH